MRPLLIIQHTCIHVLAVSVYNSIDSLPIIDSSTPSSTWARWWWLVIIIRAGMTTRAVLLRTLHGVSALSGYMYYKNLVFSIMVNGNSCSTAWGACSMTHPVVAPF